MAKYTVNSESETANVAKALAKKLKAGSVVAFFGGLGAGKTTFTRTLVKELGSEDDVSSPTFALVHCYSGPIEICHFDMYRISGFESLYSTGFFDYLDRGAILLIEWSENISEFLPRGSIKVSIEITGENSREITIEGGDVLC